MNSDHPYHNLPENPESDFKIQLTKNWLKQLVIDLELCPFANRVYESDEISYKAVDNLNPEEILMQLKLEMGRIENTGVTTSLLILNQCSFDRFMDLLDVCEEFLLLFDSKEEYQLAHFHPQYQFEDTSEKDISNFTNRSPYPIIHILPTEEVSKAIESHDDIHSVPKRNVKLMNDMGREKLYSLLLNVTSN